MEFTAVGLALGLALGLLAAVTMRRPTGTLQIAGFAVGCCALATAASYLLPVNYTSRAVIRFGPPKVQEVLSDATLEAIVTNPALDLYKKQRLQEPMKEIVETMRHHLDIRLLTRSHSAFEISFSYSDPYKAQAVVRELLRKFVERQRRTTGAESPEVLDPASEPQAPASPNRLAISLAGFVMGLLFGAVTLYLRQRRGPAWATVASHGIAE